MWESCRGTTWHATRWSNMLGSEDGALAARAGDRSFHNSRTIAARRVLAGAGFSGLQRVHVREHDARAAQQPGSKSRWSARRDRNSSPRAVGRNPMFTSRPSFHSERLRCMAGLPTERSFILAASKPRRVAGAEGWAASRSRGVLRCWDARACAVSRAGPASPLVECKRGVCSRDPHGNVRRIQPRQAHATAAVICGTIRGERAPELVGPQVLPADCRTRPRILRGAGRPFAGAERVEELLGVPANVQPVSEIEGKDRAENESDGYQARYHEDGPASWCSPKKREGG